MVVFCCPMRGEPCHQSLVDIASSKLKQTIPYPPSGISPIYDISLITAIATKKPRDVEPSPIENISGVPAQKVYPAN